MSKKVAVTGATGFVGTNICNALIKKGYAVRACVRGGPDKTAHLKAMGAELFEVTDVTDKNQLEKAFEQVDFVIAVANPMPFNTEMTKEEFVAMSVDGVKATLAAALKCGVTKVVMTATMASICGTQATKDPSHLWTEEDWNDEMGSNYSAAKTKAEEAAWAFAKENSMALTTIHPAVVLGPLIEGQQVASTNKMLLNLVDGTDKDGARSGKFGVVDARDVAEAHVVPLENRDSDGQRFLISDSDQYTYLELAKITLKLFPQFEGQIPTKNADENFPEAGRKPTCVNSKVVGLLGRPLRSVEECVKDTVNSFIDRGLLKK